MAKEKKLHSWETIEESIPFHEFEDDPIYEGMFIEKVEVGEDEKFVALKYANVETGEVKLLKNNFGIARSLRKAEKKFENDFPENILFRIEFLGKTEIAGLPFNQYKIDVAKIK